MNRLYFPLKPVLALAEYTLGASKHTSGYADTQDGKETGPALMWVKDAGTYLMSNAIPRPEGDVIYGRADLPTGLLLREPKDTASTAWNEVWDVTRTICGGDDFAEYFPLDDNLSAQLLAAARDDHTWLVLEVSTESISLVTV